VKISCPSCSAKYSIADEKVQDRLAKIRCRKCGCTIVIDGRVDPPTVQAAEAPRTAPAQASASAAGVADGAYTVDLSDDNQPTMSVQEIVDAYHAGTLTADTYVWKEGMADWETLADVAELNEALHAASAAGSRPSLSPPAAAPPDVGANLQAASLGLDASAGGRAATRPETVGSPAQDLFGSIDIAGGEHDVTTSAPGGAQREVTSASTGARNESSVLFSLSALTSGQTAPPPEPQRPGAANADDSGLIDLAALTAASGTGPTATTGGALDLGSAPLSPLGAAPLMGGTTAPLLGVPANAAQGSGNRQGLYIGGAIALAAVAGFVAFLFKEEPPPVVAAPASAPTLMAAAAMDTAKERSAGDQGGETDGDKDAEDKQADEKEAKDDKAHSKTASATTKAKTVTHSVKRPTRSKKSSSRKSSTSSSKKKSKKKSKKTSKKKTKKSSGTCNCKPNDLMCAMRCSAK
jgi:predicted Zn finger-like uncharacterized protein